MRFGSYEDQGYLEEDLLGDGTYVRYTMSYDQNLGTWAFTDTSGREVFYYSEFAWGN